jgi:hypothetical protein
MNPPAGVGSQAVQVAPISDGANPSADLAAALYVLIAQQPFLQGIEFAATSNARGVGLGNEI